ncbi:MAG: hypothetical protein ACRCZK_07445 [Oscillospiraceae bacterium]
MSKIKKYNKKELLETFSNFAMVDLLQNVLDDKLYTLQEIEQKLEYLLKQEVKNYDNN